MSTDSDFIQWFRNVPFRFQIGLISLLGLVVRIFWVLRFGSNFAVTGDSLRNLNIGERLAKGLGFTVERSGVSVATASQAPGTPVLIAVMRNLGVRSVTESKVVFSAFGALTIAFVGYIGKLISGESGARLCATLAAFSPMFILADISLNGDGLVLLLASGLILMVMTVVSKDRVTVRDWAIIGLVSAVAIYVRFSLLVLVLCMVLPATIRIGRSWRKSLRFLAVSMGVVLLLVGPWVIRNAREVGVATVSTSTSRVLVGSNCSFTYYSSELRGDYASKCLLASDDVEGDEETLSRSQTQYAREFIADNVSELPAISSVRILRSWWIVDSRSQIEREEWRETADSRLLTFGRVTNVLFMALSAVGVYAQLRLRRLLWPLLMPILSVAVVSMVAYGTYRFRLAGEVAMVILSTIAIKFLVEAFRTQSVPGERWWSPSDSDRAWPHKRQFTTCIAVVGLVVVLPFVKPLGDTVNPTDVSDSFEGRDGQSLGISDSLDRWEENSGTWVISNGSVYVLEPEANGPSIATIYPRSLNWQMRVEMSDIDTRAGVVFFFEDSENYWSVVSAPAFGRWFILETVDGNDAYLGEVEVFDAESPLPVEVSVKKKGNEVTVSVNGGEELTVDVGGAPRNAEVGLIQSSADQTSTSWDDFEVTDNDS